MGLIDEVVVERLVAGHRIEATRAERRAAALTLVSRRPELTRIQIAERVGLSDRTVTRVALANDLPSHRPFHRRPVGVTRAAVKAAILADPLVSCSEVGRQLRVTRKVAWVHYHNLVQAGELAARGINTRNPRYRGLPRKDAP